jgi:hypothetical protein
MIEESFIIDGFQFSSSKEYDEAKKELDAINLLKSKSELSNPKTTLKVYNKLLENKTFHTPVGFAFLKDLQHIILKSQIITSKDLKGIYIAPSGDSISKEKTEFHNLTIDQYKQQVKELRTRLKNSRIITFFFAMIIIVMIIMTFYTDRTMFSEYKNELTDQYASWEEELKNREQELEIKEQELDKKGQE